MRKKILKIITVMLLIRRY